MQAFADSPEERAIRAQAYYSCITCKKKAGTGKRYVQGKKVCPSAGAILRNLEPPLNGSRHNKRTLLSSAH